MVQAKLFADEFRTGGFRHPPLPSVSHPRAPLPVPELPRSREIPRDLVSSGAWGSSGCAIRLIPRSSGPLHVISASSSLSPYPSLCIHIYTSTLTRSHKVYPARSNCTLSLPSWKTPHSTPLDQGLALGPGCRRPLCCWKKNVSRWRGSGKGPSFPIAGCSQLGWFRESRALFFGGETPSTGSDGLLGRILDIWLLLGRTTGHSHVQWNGWARVVLVSDLGAPRHFPRRRLNAPCMCRSLPRSGLRQSHPWIPLSQRSLSETWPQALSQGGAALWLWIGGKTLERTGVCLTGGMNQTPSWGVWNKGPPALGHTGVKKKKNMLI